MSIDWNKYSTALETRNRGKTPTGNAVISMVVGSVQEIEGLTVEHKPVQEHSFDDKAHPLKPNRAHSEVTGEKTAERRVKLSRVWKWEIRLAD